MKDITQGGLEMKKYLVMAIVGVFLLATVLPAIAADFKFSGSYRMRGYYYDNIKNQAKDVDDKYVETQTRLRPKFTATSEGGKLVGVMYLEIGDITWGKGGGADGNLFGGTSSRTAPSSGGEVGTDGVNVETKQAYIDFEVPGTPVRARFGLQDWISSKSMIFDDDFAGFKVYGKVAPVAFSLFDIKAEEKTGKADSIFGKDDYDVYGMTLDVAPVENINVGVYGLYALDRKDASVGQNRTGTWIGLTSSGKFGPVKYTADFAYGQAEFMSGSAKKKQKGSVIDVSAGADIGPVGALVKGFWSSKYKTKDSGDRDGFPTLAPSYKFTDIYWGATNDAYKTKADPTGYWGILGEASIKPVDKLTLRGQVGYFAWTGDKATSPTGKKEIGTEANLKATYQMYKELGIDLLIGKVFMAGDLEDITEACWVMTYNF